ncbi:hypothetical protein [Burkholderia thailandensis]|uniref:hypothetical protein n=1 Tax=Burkholderia thailandensis TaxID=57975 RepID=UPI0012DA77FF|nr:hypothetical protein [Burkholderia thailandensis]
MGLLFHVPLSPEYDEVVFLHDVQFEHVVVELGTEFFPQAVNDPPRLFGNALNPSPKVELVPLDDDAAGQPDLFQCLTQLRLAMPFHHARPSGWRFAILVAIVSS